MANGKRYAAASKTVDREKTYDLAEAVKIVKANAKAKFDETIEVAMNLGIDPRHADQAVRVMVELPSGTGKTVKVAVFARGPKADEAKAAGADLVGAEDLAEKINGGEMGFDRCIAGDRAAQAVLDSLEALFHSHAADAEQESRHTLRIETVAVESHLARARRGHGPFHDRFAERLFKRRVTRSPCWIVRFG